MLAVYATGLLLFGLSSVPVEASTTGCGALHGAWTELPIADYPELATPSMYGSFRTTTAFAVDPNRPERMFASNGKSVLRSRDGGCSWQVVYLLPPRRTRATA